MAEVEELASESEAVPAITDQPSVPGLEGFVRLSSTPKVTDDALGPLAPLVGTWVGNTGWNMIALPQDKGFLLLVRPYIETITFAPIGAPSNVITVVGWVTQSACSLTV